MSDEARTVYPGNVVFTFHALARIAERLHPANGPKWLAKEVVGPGLIRDGSYLPDWYRTNARNDRGNRFIVYRDWLVVVLATSDPGPAGKQRVVKTVVTRRAATLRA